MRTRSKRDYVIVLPPRAPEPATLQLLQRYLDASRNTASPTGNVCALCQRMMEFWLSRTATSFQVRKPTCASSFKHRTLNQMYASARKGCRLCSVLHRKLRWALALPSLRSVDSYSTLTLDLTLPTHSKPGYATDLGSINLARSASSSGYYLLNVQLWTPSHRAYAHIATSTIPKTLQYVSTANGAAFHLARSWLKRCITHHGGCTVQSHEPVFVPSRLLEIGWRQQDGSAALTVRLRAKSDVLRLQAGQTPTYVALSHQWGDSQPLKLSKDTRSQLEAGLPIDYLPKTFRDAVIVTATLGFLRIWIDSLCIAQDSPEDWEVEAQLMGHVYSNCTLNLAALDAHNCHQGLFSRRDTHSFRSYNVRTTTGDIVRVSHGHVGNGPERQGLHYPLPGLLSRGWVVQEVTLSPRTLYYCSDMLYWECRSCIACESYPALSKTRTWLHSSQMGKKWFQEMLAPENESGPAAPSNGASLAARYWKTCVTYPKDRYYTFLGLAEIVQKSRGKPMVAGLWTADLVFELAWATKWFMATDRQPWMPTWSWLSLNTKVHLVSCRNDYPAARDWAQILRIPDPDIQFSEHVPVTATARSIQLRAPLLRLPSWQNPQGNCRRHIECDWGNIMFSFDMRADDGVELYVLALFQGREKDFYGLLITPSPEAPEYWVRVGCCHGDTNARFDVLRATESRVVALI